MTLNIVTSRLWRHRVTWRHRWQLAFVYKTHLFTLYFNDWL